VTPVTRPADVLGAPVRARDVRVGTITGVVGDGSLERLIGLEVTSRDGRRWFLPSVAGSYQAGAVHLDTTLVLVETGDLEGYERLGAVVIRSPGQLEGMVVDEDGRLVRESPRDSPSVSLRTATGTSVA